MSRRLLLTCATAIALVFSRANASNLYQDGGVFVNHTPLPVGGGSGGLDPVFNRLDIFSATSGLPTLYMEHSAGGAATISFGSNTGTRSCSPWDTGSCTTEFTFQDTASGGFNITAGGIIVASMAQSPSSLTFKNVPISFSGGATFTPPSAVSLPTGQTTGNVFYETSGGGTLEIALGSSATWTGLLTAGGALTGSSLTDTGAESACFLDTGAGGLLAAGTVGAGLSCAGGTLQVSNSGTIDITNLLDAGVTNAPFVYSDSSGNLKSGVAGQCVRRNARVLQQLCAAGQSHHDDPIVRNRSNDGNSNRRLG